MMTEPRMENSGRFLRWMLGWAGVAVLLAVVVSIMIPPRPIPKSLYTGGRSLGRQLTLPYNDLHQLSLAIEAYHVDHGAYPAWAVGREGANAFAPGSPGYDIPTFAIATPERPGLHSLTSPVPHLPGTYPSDRFDVDSLGVTYGYWHNEDGSFWILFSPGPDGVYDIVPWKDFAQVDSERRNDVPSALIQKTWDPTNGLVSRGDLWRMRDFEMYQLRNWNSLPYPLVGDGP